MTDQPSLVDRLLAHMQTRYPMEFEICLLSAQNDELAEELATAKAAGSAQQELALG